MYQMSANKLEQHSTLLPMFIHYQCPVTTDPHFLDQILVKNIIRLLKKLQSVIPMMVPCLLLQEFPLDHKH